MITPIHTSTLLFPQDLNFILILLIIFIFLAGAMYQVYANKKDTRKPVISRPKTRKKKIKKKHKKRVSSKKKQYTKRTVEKKYIQSPDTNNTVPNGIEIPKQ